MYQPKTAIFASRLLAYEKIVSYIFVCAFADLLQLCSHW